MDIKVKESSNYFSGYRTAKRLNQAIKNGAYIEYDEEKDMYFLIAGNEKLTLIGSFEIDEPSYTDKGLLDTTKLFGVPWLNDQIYKNNYTGWEYITEKYDIEKMERDFNADIACRVYHKSTPAFVKLRLQLCKIAYKHHLELISNDNKETLTETIKINQSLTEQR